MGFIEAGRHCATCGRQTLHRQARPNHVLHFLVAFFTCGLWVVPWVVMSMADQPWLCAQCGATQSGGGSGGAKGIVYTMIVLGSLVALGVLGLAVAFIARRMAWL